MNTGLSSLREHPAGPFEINIESASGCCATGLRVSSCYKSIILFSIFCFSPIEVFFNDDFEELNFSN